LQSLHLHRPTAIASSPRKQRATEAESTVEEATLQTGSSLVNLGAMKAPSKAQPKAQPQTANRLTVQGARQQVTLCQCGRCGHIWKPRRPDPPPSKCPSCFSPLWNKGRAYHIEGAEPPTRVPQPRGKPFSKGFDARSSDHTEVGDPAGAAEEGTGTLGQVVESDKATSVPGPRAKRQTSRSHAPHEGEAHSTADKS